MLNLNPGHADAWNNLGVLSLERQQWPMAERCFQLSLKIDPEDAKTHYLHARALLGLGQRDAARQAIAEAMRRRPGQPEFQALHHQLESAPPP